MMWTHSSSVKVLTYAKLFNAAKYIMWHFEECFQSTEVIAKCNNIARIGKNIWYMKKFIHYLCTQNISVLGASLFFCCRFSNFNSAPGVLNASGIDPKINEQIWMMYQISNEYHIISNNKKGITNMLQRVLQ